MVALVVALTLAVADVPRPGDPRAYDGVTETVAPEVEPPTVAAPEPAPVAAQPSAPSPGLAPPPAPKGTGLGWLVLSGITFSLGPATQYLAWKVVGTPTCPYVHSKTPPYQGTTICGPGILKSALVLTLPVAMGFTTASFAAASGHRRGRHDAWHDLYVDQRSRTLRPHWITGAIVGVAGCVGLGLGPAMLAGAMPACERGCPAGFVPAGFVVTNLGVAGLGAGLGLIAYAAAYDQHRAALPLPPTITPTVSRDSLGIAVSGRF
jgi:hypothetical protein